MRKNLLSYMIATSLLLSTAAHVMEPSDSNHINIRSSQQKQEVATDIRGFKERIINRKPGTTAFVDPQSKHLKLFDPENELIGDLNLKNILNFCAIEEIHSFQNYIYLRAATDAFSSILYIWDFSKDDGQEDFQKIECTGLNFEAAEETQEIFQILSDGSLNKILGYQQTLLLDSPFRDPQLSSRYHIFPSGSVYSCKIEQDKYHSAIFRDGQWVQSDAIELKDVSPEEVITTHYTKQGIYVSFNSTDSESEKQTGHLYFLEKDNWRKVTFPQNILKIIELRSCNSSLICLGLGEDGKHQALTFDGKVWQTIDFSGSPVVPEKMDIDHEGNIIFSGIGNDGIKKLFIKMNDKYLDISAILSNENIVTPLNVHSIRTVSNGIYNVVLEESENPASRFSERLRYIGLLNGNVTEKTIILKDGQIVEAMRNLHPVVLHDPTATSSLNQFTKKRDNFSHDDFSDLMEKLNLLKKLPKNSDFVFDQLNELFTNLMNKAAANGSSASANECSEATANEVTEAKTEIFAGLEAMLEAYPNAWFTPYLHALYFEVGELAQEAYMAEASFAPITAESLSQDYDKQLEKYKQFLAGESIEVTSQPTPVAERLEYTRTAYETLSEIVLQAPAFAQKQGYTWLYEKITLALTQLGKLPAFKDNKKDPA